MLLKWIVCACLPKEKEPFSKAQEQWSKLTGASGFQGQFGGWDGNKACILGLWRDASSYQDFMSALHDDITDSNDQAQSYQSIKVHILKSSEEIGQGFPRDLRGDETLRVACCELREGRFASFKEQQEQLWNPGMGACEGFRGGRWGYDEEARLALVTTLWDSEDAHNHYQREVFPALKEAAQTGRDMVTIQGYKLKLEAKWLVQAP